MPQSFICQNCGLKSPKWLGRCPDCGEWNCLIEEPPSRRGQSSSRSIIREDSFDTPPVSLTQLEGEESERIKLGMNEWDRVLGGGLVRGSVILVYGDPGIGKSTLLLQISDKLAKDEKVLYISAEESARQIKIRSGRLGISSPNLYIYTGTCFERMSEHVESLNPRIVILDSIQTTYTDRIESPPGSISQIKEMASQWMCLSKQRDMATFLVGHVTKAGSIAGPRVLEHIVDTVLGLEGDRHHAFRILRSVKNRFGPTNEIGLFEMTGQGMSEVTDPSRLFLNPRQEPYPGSVVICSMEGTRPILVELQALVSPGTIGMARRTCDGVDPNRAALLIAVLEKRLGLYLQDKDIYINVVGGLRLDEPAVDLGIMLAIYSSLKDRPLPIDLAVMGEVGLTGEIRPIYQSALRRKEVEKRGFRACLLPCANNSDELAEKQGIKTLYAESVQQAIELIFGTRPKERQT
ncbi:DNA repair protein RadA [bacterium]|nr:DNA repair protein RadA [bacterium]